jgi:hypothetical protein
MAAPPLKKRLITRLHHKRATLHSVAFKQARGKTVEALKLRWRTGRFLWRNLAKHQRADTPGI